MSDIQEEMKRQYKRAEENDNIFLQDKIEKYKESNKEYIELNKELYYRINKAIEYINNNSLYEEEYDYDYEENIHLSGINDTKARNDLLNILQGDNK